MPVHRSLRMSFLSTLKLLRLLLFLIHRVAYGSKAHLLNMFLYLLGLLPLTYLIVTMKPTMNITEAGEHNITMVPVSFPEVRMTAAHSNITMI